MPRKVPLGARGEVEVPYVNAGVLEDHEEEMRVLLAYNGKNDPVPLGKDMGALVTIVHAILKESRPDLTRDEVRRAINMQTVFAYVSAVAEAFGMEHAPAGEAVSPASST